MYTHRASEFTNQKCDGTHLLPGANQPPAGRIVRYPRSKILYHQGDVGDFVYEVVSGLVQSSRVLKCGRRQIDSFGFPGDTLGLPHEGLHTETCEVLVPSVFKVIRVRFEGNERYNLRLQDWLLERALAEVSRLQERTACLATMPSTQKVAVFLNMMGRKIGRSASDGIVLELPMHREDIADFLGMRVETVSRSFSELRGKGIIDLPEPTLVVVRDPDALSKLAEAT